MALKRRKNFLQLGTDLMPTSDQAFDFDRCTFKDMFDKIDV